MPAVSPGLKVSRRLLASSRELSNHLNRRPRLLVRVVMNIVSVEKPCKSPEYHPYDGSAFCDDELECEELSGEEDSCRRENFFDKSGTRANLNYVQRTPQYLPYEASVFCDEESKCGQSSVEKEHDRSLSDKSNARTSFNQRSLLGTATDKIQHNSSTSTRRLETSHKTSLKQLNVSPIKRCSRREGASHFAVEDGSFARFKSNEINDSAQKSLRSESFQPLSVSLSKPPLLHREREVISKLKDMLSAPTITSNNKKHRPLSMYSSHNNFERQTSCASSLRNIQVALSPDLSRKNSFQVESFRIEPEHTDERAASVLETARDADVHSLDERDFVSFDKRRDNNEYDEELLEVDEALLGPAPAGSSFRFADSPSPNRNNSTMRHVNSLADVAIQTMSFTDFQRSPVRRSSANLIRRTVTFSPSRVAEGTQTNDSLRQKPCVKHISKAQPRAQPIMDVEQLQHKGNVVENYSRNLRGEGVAKCLGRGRDVIRSRDEVSRSRKTLKFVPIRQRSRSASIGPPKYCSTVSKNGTSSYSISSSEQELLSIVREQYPHWKTYVTSLISIGGEVDIAKHFYGELSERLCRRRVVGMYEDIDSRDTCRADERLKQRLSRSLPAGSTSRFTQLRILYRAFAEPY